MQKKDYDAIIRENFDLSDRHTRQYLVSLDEAGRDQVLDALAESLYNSIVDKVDEIDFGTIPLSRGDITKVENFSKTEECLSIIRKLVLEYKQNPATVDIVTTAIQNIKDLKAQFIKGYALDVELPMLIYNLITLSIIRSTSMMIATCVKYISDPNTKSFKQALDEVAYKNTIDDVMFQQLSSFNSLCKDGSMMKLLVGAIKNNKIVHKESFDDGWTQNTPDDNNIDPTFPASMIADEDDDLFDGNDNDKAEDIFGNDNDPINTSNQNNVPDEVQKPIVPDAPAVNPAEDEFPDEEPADDVQTDDLPVSEPDDAMEPIPAEIPVHEPEPEEETAPDVNPNPETDPNLDDSSPIIEFEPGEESEGIQDEGAIEKAINIAKNVDLKGKVVIGAAGILGAIALAQGIKFVFFKIFIPLIRDLVYIYCNTRFKLADYWKLQAEFLEANADELENSTSDMDPKKKEKVINKQRKWANTFRKWSNFFNLDKSATKKAAEDQKKEDEKNAKKKVDQNDNGEDVLF